MGAKLIERLAPIGRGDHAVAFALECLSDCLAYIRVVVDYEHHTGRSSTGVLGTAPPLSSLLVRGDTRLGRDVGSEVSQATGAILVRRLTSAFNSRSTTSMSVQS